MKKLISMLLICAVFIGCFSACGNKIQDENGKYILFEFNGENIYLDEAYIYAQTTKEEYEKEYGTDIWGQTIEAEEGVEMDVEELAKSEVINNIIQTKVLITMADDYGVSLTTEEEQQQDQAAEDFYNNLTDKQIKQYGMELDTAKTVMKENLLAGKVYDMVMKESGVEVSDEQARMTTFYDMYFECYYEDDYGNIVVYTEDKIADQKQKAEDTYATIVGEAGTEDFNISFLGSTNDLKYAGTHTMKKDEIIETYGQDVEELLYSMNNGDISQVVETEYGFHIFQMIALTDEEATASNKEKMSKEAETEYFSNLLEGWTEDLDKGYSYSKSVNEEVLDKIQF